MPYTIGEILEIAKDQKGILWCVVASLVNIFVRIPLLYLVVTVLNIYFIYRLAKGLRAGYPWLWAIGALVPLVNIILLLTLNQRATNAIKASGFVVGLMGANLREIKEKITTSLPNPS